MPRSLSHVAEVYTIGAKKYADRNWEKGLQWGRVFSALLRHAWAWWWGEQKDPVDGQRHLASVCWCALALMEYEDTHPELDDRPYKRDERETQPSSTYTLLELFVTIIQR